MQDNKTGTGNNQTAQQTEKALSENESLQPSTDLRDEKIKNEPDTARLRSERQSVIDGEKERTTD